jgi:hypothetical protein
MAQRSRRAVTGRDSKRERTSALLTTPVGVDLIRFEKNLLQMGFFGAHDTRHVRHFTRRIEQIVNRDGQKIKVAAEFRASQEFGLPSTSDRDKYIAFMRIAMRQKLKHGALENPIRFTGYHLLKELGFSYSGENYEDINRWGQRMADTTITSEQVIYLASRKKYANKTVHVFRSFTRAGQSSEDGTSRTECFEVVLEDWLLDNLNQSYVVPEDFNAYRTLKRPTAKGIFGYLHLWFHASQGRPIEKDYGELCMLLNVPAYKHISKIQETIGRSLDELGAIQYLRKWDIKPMVTKHGYKLVLEPGDEVLRVLATTQRKQLPNEPATSLPLTGPQEQALQILVERGISLSKANSLVRRFEAKTIVKQIAYAEFLFSRDKRSKFENPPGFIIYTIENDLPVPTKFVGDVETSTNQRSHRVDVDSDSTVLSSYDAFIEEEVDRVIGQRFPGDELGRKVRDTVEFHSRSDEAFGSMLPVQQTLLAERLIWQEVRQSITLPAFEDWRKSRPQLGLFR